MNSDLQPELDQLPPTFRHGDAIAVMSERSLRRLLGQQHVVRLGRGLYRKAGANGDEDLIEIAGQRPRATLCLRSALVRHDLIDDIPAAIDIALPRNSEAAHTRAPISWHWSTPGRSTSVGNCWTWTRPPASASTARSGRSSTPSACGTWKVPSSATRPCAGGCAAAASPRH